MLFLFNAHHHDVEFTLPDRGTSIGWEVVLDTSIGEANPAAPQYGGGNAYPLAARSMALLLGRPEEEAEKAEDDQPAKRGGGRTGSKGGSRARK
jgi:hypothetical protein